MFTQCPKCETIFRLSAGSLSKAGGQVRCGRCGDVFNALTRLAESPGAFAIGESSLELETRADRILHDPAAPPDRDTPVPFDATGGEGQIEHLEVEDLDMESLGAENWSAEEFGLRPPVDSPDAPQSLESTLPPGDLERIFIEAEPPPSALEPPRAPLDADADARTGSPPGEPATAPAMVEREVSSRDPLARNANLEREVSSDRPTEPHAILEREVSIGRPTEPRAILEREVSIGRPTEPRAIVEREFSIEVPEAIRGELLAGPAPPAAVARPPARRAVAGWAGAATLLGLLLAVQLVHQNREWLVARDPFLGRTLRLLYARLGRPLPVASNLAAYQLRGWGATGDPGADGALRLRASILNTSALPQPYPLLRVTLADRFGHALGSRDFEPAEYLRGPSIASHDLDSAHHAQGSAIESHDPNLGEHPSGTSSGSDDLNSAQPKQGPSLASHDLDSAEHTQEKPLGSRTAEHAALAPGERADALLEIMDPGINAEGFEIDICLRGAERGLACANDAAGRR